MSKPTLPSSYSASLKLWGKLWPGDAEPILVHSTGDMSDHGYFFVKEIPLFVDLSELSLLIDPLSAQVNAIKAEISAMKAEHHVNVLDKEDEIQRLLALKYEPATSDDDIPF